MIDVGVYETEKYTAYIYPKSIVICTSFQCFRITSDRYKTAYIDMLVHEIIKGKIKRMDDFKTYNGELTWSNCGRPSLQLSPSME